jgi:hypothetical protein
MHRDDSFSDHGRRSERSTRLAAALLLVSSVVTYYLTDLLVERLGARGDLFQGYALAARVLAPAGAILLVMSLAVRALVRPFSHPSARAQLATGVVLLVLGLLHMLYGTQIQSAFIDYVGPTGNAGTRVYAFLDLVAHLIALPLGIALTAAQPLIRLAQTWQVRLSTSGPPGVESLD